MKTKSNGGVGTEDEYRDLIIKSLNKVGHISRVESPKVSAGIPDLNFVDKEEGWESWIEIKWWDGVKFPEVRPTQVGWHRNRARVSINSWILLGTFANTHVLIPGSAAESLASTKKDMENWVAMSYGYWVNIKVPVSFIMERIHVEYNQHHRGMYERHNG